MRQHLEDFLVEELPAYPPCGQGMHLFVHFEKMGLTTPSAVRSLADALQVPASRASYAGYKDKQGITRQWASFEQADAKKLEHLSIPGIEILDCAYHSHKLRTGHLMGNRFRIRLREPIAGAETAQAILDELQSHGCPNYFGEQRFGREGDNAQAAWSFLTGQTRPPRDPKQRRFLFSAFQSELFNHWLADRVARGELDSAIEGDLMRKEDTGGLFTSDDLEDLKARAKSFAISATGPIFGATMRRPAATAWEREESLLTDRGVSEDMLIKWRRLGEGTRRACRVRPTNVRIESEPNALVIHFELPKGAYATTILREVMKPEV